MPKVTSVVNQYRGVNAHAHSFWQVERKWNRVHGNFITELMRSLRSDLRKMGYTADMEESLQIRRVGNDLNCPIDTEHPYMAVAIREQLETLRDGPIVAWLEFLSPTNKGKGEDAGAYRVKREMLLEKKIVFIEIDLLHQTPPTLEYFADYSERATEVAHPYRIMILDPRPTFERGLVYAREFDVDDPLPAMTIPLNGADVLKFDFNAVYQTMFAPSFYGDAIDYSALPLKFNSYRPADQARIARRMLSVLRAAAQGQSLEDGPFAIDDLPLEQALAEIEVLKATVSIEK